MKGGGLYGTPAAPASIAIPVAAAAVGTTAAVGAAAAYYKHVPKTTRKNIVKALERMKVLLETPNEGYLPDMVLLDSHNLERIGRLIKGAVSVNVADADEKNDNEDKLPSVLRRHFTKVGEEEVDNLFPDDGKSNELRGIFLKSLKPKSGLVSGLVAQGYLKHGTTNVPARLGYGVGQTEREILHPKKAEKYKDYGRTLARENKVSAEVKALTAEERAVAEAVGSVPGLSSSLEADANLAAKEEAEHEDRVARGGFANLS